MKYFVRTSHIVSGLIYGLVIFGWSLPLFVSHYDPDEWLLNVIIASCVSLAFFSFIHYIVLGRFHPWAKMPDREESDE